MTTTYNLRCRSNKLYRYTPLDTSEQSIRLLRVLPTLIRGYLSLAIKHVSLAEAKERYHTISYTWGNDEPSHRVYIDSQCLLLRNSISSFLMHYHKARFAVYEWLWIDSICINQSDIAEKNQQVSLMGQIFRDSCGTFIWLDELSTKGSFAMSYQSYRSMFPKNVDDDEASRLLEIFLYGSEELKIRENRGTLRQDAIQLFKHNYWRRIWIVQEVVLSPRISIVLGCTTISLDLILNSLYDSIPYNQSHISGVFEDDEYLDYTLQRLNTNRMGNVEDRQSLSLLTLVYEYRAHGCKDIRDRVYGLLALTPMSDRLIVDYNCHIVALFAETLRSYVADMEDFGPKRENMHMYDVRSLMRALDICPDVFVKYQNQEMISHNVTNCFKIAMFPTVVYTIGPDRNGLTFLRLIDANDRSVNINLSGHADRRQDHEHTGLLAEICNLEPSDSEARYLMCALPLSGFQVLLCVSRTTDIVLVGTVERTGKPNTEGKLLTPCSMPSRVLNNIHVELIRSRTDFLRAAFEREVEWPGYVIRCSIEELVHLQGSHDRLDPEYVSKQRR